VPKIDQQAIILGLTPTPLPGGEGLNYRYSLPPSHSGRRGQGDEAVHAKEPVKFH